SGDCSTGIGCICRDARAVPTLSLCRGFIELCLQRDPKERPTAKDLLRHAFIRRAKRTTYLTELIERHSRWAATHKGEEEDNWDTNSGRAPAERERVDEDMWDFGTVRLVGERGGIVNRPSLNAMDESATNARASRPLESPDEYGERRREGSPTKMRDFALQPSDTVRPPNPGSRQSSPQRKAVPLQQPQHQQPLPSPTRVPLPKSPMKPLQRDNLETPRASRPMPPLPVEQSPDYDRELQGQLQRDLGILSLNLPPNIEGKTSPQLSSSQWPTPPAPPAHQNQPRPLASKQISLPEIPPYRGNQIVQQQRVSSQQLSAQRVHTPVPVPGGAQGPRPLPLPSKAQSPSPSEFSNAPSSFPSPAPANPNGDLDALNDVIFPALEEALKRRQINLQHTYKPGQNLAQVTPQQQRAEASHEKLRKLVYKLAHVCKEIDHYDKAEPVGMGREVGSFLEGLLEEILVRVEPLDEDEEV
ncbi:hypothetical protein FDECE_17867, partial [Fusarium decemcellulare]